MMLSLIYLLLTLNSVSYFHDAEIAVFKLYETDSGLDLIVSFDKEDFLNSQSESVRKIEEIIIQNYINETTKWEINHEVVDVKVTKIIYQKDHIRVDCRMLQGKKDIFNIRITNAFLLDIKDQSNVIMIDVNEKSRDFRMSLERQEIQVKY